MNTKTIDLRTCVPGQKLRARDGTISTYVKYYPDDYYPHTVQYPNGKYGIRNDDGSAYKHGELDSIDIVEILPFEKGDTIQTEVSDGSTASYYELPDHAEELQDLISYRNMNAQIGEIFRACYRYGRASHSDMLRDAKKIAFYAKAEVERLEKYNV